jgi:hypothetical protein
MNVFLLLLLAIISLLIIGLIVTNSQTAPGLSWKINYLDYPELQDIYDKFVKSCITPDVPESWFENASKNVVFQEMRKECMELNPLILEEKYTKYETEAMEKSEWSHDIREFFSDKYFINHSVTKSVDAVFSELPIDISQKKCEYVPRVEEYTPRLGCYRRHISFELETFATEKIKQLMSRLHLPNKLEKLSDSRGASFTPQNGFMECHTNRFHLAGWRLYMHYLPENGESFFAYRHCYDGSLRVIPDSNTAANMFRIRKLPDALLWHSLWTDTPRHSWGIYLPPELAQELKKLGKRL